MSKGLKAIHITGDIKLITGMTQASPESAYVDTSGDSLRMSYGKGMGSVTPCTPTMKTPFREIRPSREEGGDDQSVSTLVPIVTANSLRGQFRRFAADRIEKHLIANKEQISLAAHHVLTCGAATGSPAGGTPSVSLAQEWASSGYFGLFGGGPYMMRSGAKFNNLWLKCRTTVETGTVPPDVDAKLIEAWQSTHVQMFKRMDDLLTFRDATGLNVVVNYEQVFDEWLGLRNETSAKRKAAKESKEPKEKGNSNKLDTWSFIEVVNPGSRFFFDIGSDSAFTNESHVGLLIRCVEDLVTKQALGGWTRNGFGRFVADLGYEIADGDGKIHKGSLLRFDEATRKHVLSTDAVVGTALSAWDDELATMNAADIERLCKAAKKAAEEEEDA